MGVATCHQPRAFAWIAFRLALSGMRALRDGVALGAHQMRQLRLSRGYLLLEIEGAGGLVKAETSDQMSNLFENRLCREGR